MRDLARRGALPSWRDASAPEPRGSARPRRLPGRPARRGDCSPSSGSPADPADAGSIASLGSGRRPGPRAARRWSRIADAMTAAGRARTSSRRCERAKGCGSGCSRCSARASRSATRWSGGPTTGGRSPTTRWRGCGRPGSACSALLAAAVGDSVGRAAYDALRVAYRRLLLSLAARDLAGDVAVDDVAAELADLAEATLEAALADRASRETGASAGRRGSR